jgi:hypothetical protein
VHLLFGGMDVVAWLENTTLHAISEWQGCLE